MSPGRPVAAIVGTGLMGRVHAGALRAARGRLAAVVGLNPELGAAAAAELGADRAATLEEVCADPAIDVVHVCTPNATHGSITRSVLEAGKHVVCEKPLATSSDEARVLRDTAAARGVVATVPFVYRFHPMVREMRARVATGAAGDLSAVLASYLQDWLLEDSDDNWRVDPRAGGPSRAFADIGSHLVDLVEFVTGQRLTRIATTATTVVPRRGGREVTTEDQVGLLGRTDRDATVTLLVSQVAPGHKNALTVELVGRRTSLRFEQETPDRLWVGRRRGSELMVRDPEVLSSEAARYSPVPGGHPLGYRDAFEAFVRDTYAAIGGQRVEGLPGFQDGCRAALVTESVLRSASDDTWVGVPGA